MVTNAPVPVQTGRTSKQLVISQIHHYINLHSSRKSNRLYTDKEKHFWYSMSRTLQFTNMVLQMQVSVGFPVFLEGVGSRLTCRRWKVLLVDTVAETVRNSAQDSTPYFPCCHFSQFRHALFTVEWGVWSDDQVWTIFQRTCNKQYFLVIHLINYMTEPNTSFQFFLR